MAQRVEATVWRIETKAGVLLYSNIFFLLYTVLKIFRLSMHHHRRHHYLHHRRRSSSSSWPSPLAGTFSWWGCCGLSLWHKPTELACSLFLCLFFCLQIPFNCISFHKFSRQLSASSLCVFPVSHLPHWSFQLYDDIFKKVSLSHDIILCGRLGLKRQLTNLSLIHISEPTRPRYIAYKSLPQPWFNPLWLTGLKAPTN